MNQSTLSHLPVTNLNTQAMLSNPFPRLAELRETAPVSRVKSSLTPGGGFLVARYDDVRMVYANERLSSDAMRHGRGGAILRMMPRSLRLLTDSMVFKDAPDHGRLRGLVNKAFTPRMVQQMSDDIEHLVDGLVERLAAKGDVDLIEDLAIPLPLGVISTMLGVDDADRDDFHRWVQQLTNSTAGGGPLQIARAIPTANRMTRLFERLADKARAEPDGSLIAGLVRAREEDDDHLSEPELLAMIFLLLLAGHDTTGNLIGNGVLALIEHPDQLAKLRAAPELIGSAVEELLRFTSPVPCGAARFALEDLEIAGVPIPRGSQVLGMLASANRDDRVFQDPDSLDLARDPNSHLAFGFGAHFCLGNRLARLEGRLAIGALVRRFEHLELRVPAAELTYKPTPSLRGLYSLPLRVA